MLLEEDRTEDLQLMYNLLGRVKESFKATANLSLFMKQLDTILSSLALKSSCSCTMVLSFSGLITITFPLFFTYSAIFEHSSFWPSFTLPSRLYMSCKSSVLSSSRSMSSPLVRMLFKWWASSCFSTQWISCHLLEESR